MEKYTKQDLLKRIEEYAGNFTPEWNLSFGKPDAGAAIALIFADQMAGNRALYDTLVPYYREMFTGMLEISQKPPRPARTVLLVSLMENTIPGLYLDPGTKFRAGSDEKQEIIFETVSRTYITEAVLDTIFMTGRGYTRKLLGFFKQPLEDGTEEVTEIKEMQPFRLFSSGQEKRIQRSVFLWHSRMFFGGTEKICLEVQGGEELLQAIEAGALKLFYVQEGWIQEIRDFKIEKEKLYLPACNGEKEKRAALMIKEEKEWERDISAEDFYLTSCGQWTAPDEIYTEEEEKSDHFLPFGDRIALDAQCYIGKDGFFSRKNATISMEFQLSFEKSTVGEQKRKQEDLKVIKRRDYLEEQKYVAEVHADEIAVEYYSTKGWKKLQMSENITNLFQENHSTTVKLDFKVPQDWVREPGGICEGHCMRLRVKRAENCYYQPAVHYYPVISRLRLACRYEDYCEHPEKIERIGLWKKEDITPHFEKKQAVVLFPAWNGEEPDSICIGFSAQMQGGPVNLWIQTEKEGRKQDGQLFYYYYGKKGWKRLKVIDHTENLSHSGIITFFPPTDMEKTDLHGQEKYYLCIRGYGKNFENRKICDIRLNGVQVINQRTAGEEEYYIEVSKPDMEFPLNTTGLLRADVWVNETGEHTLEQMKELKEKYPDRTRLEWNERGEIKHFYVLWKEVRRFESTEETRVYKLDRSADKIIFGDGIHKKIPKITDDAAFCIQAYYCNGTDGNVEKGSITDTYANILFIDQVYNPLPAYGGSPMESRENVMQRGAGLLSSHQRLITQEDYIREIRLFSETIDKVKCITKKGTMAVILLMKDYQEGSDSFYRIREELENYILRKCSVAIQPEQLLIIEPLFVEIHISVWMDLKDEDGFALKLKMKERLERYLDPVNGRNGLGWEIGVFPQYSQLRMEINAMKENAVVRKIMVTAGYHDGTGYHECGLKEVKGAEMAVIKSGKHHIYISQGQEDRNWENI